MLPYASTIFVSAFLLFLIQPIIARQILPWFGGSAAVWTTALLFFQTVLLAGYAYAHATIRWLAPRTAVAIHVGLLALSLLWLPVVANAAHKPTGAEEPIKPILALLLGAVGLPYLLLASTSPLLQAWYWRQHRATPPYRLFALSNVASLLALLGYPVLVEPWMGGFESARLWSALYVVFVLVCAYTGVTSLRAISRVDAPAESVAPPLEATATGSFGGGKVLLVLTLSAMGSSLLVAVTNHLTQNIASVPFLWVVPLALYLVTFIVCFDRPRWYVRRVFVPLVWVAIVLMAWRANSLEIEEATSIFAAGLFVGCMYCHGELARLKPDPDHLTKYYLIISLGGALGALAVALIAPLALRGYYELHILLVSLAALVVVRTWSSRFVALASFAVTAVVGYLCYLDVEEYSSDARVMVRDAYGVVRTFDQTLSYRAFYHGSIEHGGQLLGINHMLPASYFGETSGYGRVFSSLPKRPRKVGVIGLGVGGLLAWAEPGDQWVFYELSPTVERIARSEFTYLTSTPAKVNVVLGDGRLSLEREQPRGFDVLAVDAFTGDSIPMHLLTREAFAVFAKHLAPGGVMVFQATNRYVNIKPVIKRLAGELGFEARVVADEPWVEWQSDTSHVIVTKDLDLFDAPLLDHDATPINDRPDLPAFTDDYHNLLRIIDLQDE